MHVQVKRVTATRNTSRDHRAKDDAFYLQCDPLAAPLSVLGGLINGPTAGKVRPQNGSAQTCVSARVCVCARARVRA